MIIQINNYKLRGENNEDVVTDDRQISTTNNKTLGVNRVDV